MKPKLPALSPIQRLIFDEMVCAAESGQILNLWTRSGFGRTTILKHLQQALTAKYIGMREFASAQQGQHPLAIEETLLKLIDVNLDAGTPLIFDDFHLLLKIGSHCYSYPRANYLDAISQAIAELTRAQKYGLQPKRGVLLLGPPGTGKTTIGKALAHRLRGKFFLIDGTIISGTDHFYGHVAHIFEQAKENAPSVIFVDDSDVIFESGQEHGLYRYLLTMLDGLESESIGRVCVMLTAMDIRHIPPALIRSGRVELWLETKLPDRVARANLVEKLVSDLDSKETMRFDIDEIAIASEGCTPADLKRLINEAKIKYAWDESHARPTKSLTEYTLEAITDLKGLKRRYEASRKQAADSSRPVWFNVASP